MQIHKPQIFDFETEEQFFSKLEEYLVDKILDTNAKEGAVRIALSYGYSCSKLYKKIPQNIGIPWDRVFLYQVDELLTKENSFQKQIRDNFGDDFLNEIGEINFFNLDYPPDMIVKDYTEYLENLDGVFFDITVLELSKDGSFAGIFSNGDHLKMIKEPVIKVSTPAYYEDKERVTLNIESILNSDEIILLNYGEGNKNNIIELLEGDSLASAFPAKFLLAHPRLKIFHFCS